MSWMAKLYETYEAGTRLDLPESEQLMPISHTRQAAHLNMVINGDGEFIRVELLDKLQLVIPATEKSAGRTRGVEAHGLSDKIQYIASDYLKKGGKKDHGYTKYIEQLTDWADFEPDLKKLHAILKYIQVGDFIKDLYRSSVIPESKASFLYIKHKNKIGFLDKDRTGPVKVKFIDVPDVFKLITQKNDFGEIQKENLSCNDEIELEEKYKITEIDIGSLLVCWTVEIPNVNPSATWLDKELQDSWIKFDASKVAVKGLCLISGEKDKVLSTNFPANIRGPGDKAKLLSSNDFNGFTFKGKFTDTKESIKKYGQQSFGVGLIETQKAHNALRWLISRQGFRNGDQAIVAWAVSGNEIPQPMEDTWDLLGEELQEISIPLLSEESQIDHTIDLGQSFSVALGKCTAGYQAKLNTTDNIIIMGLDSTNGFKGRMAVTYYQEFFPEEYIKRISEWHHDFAWYQRHKIEEDVGKKKSISKTIWSISAPSPRSIWEAIYGSKLNDSLKKNTVERILPCIVEARPFPRDLVDKAVRKACNRSIKRLSDQYSNGKSEIAAWEKHLGIACALYRGFCKRHPKQTKEYIMGLEQDNNSRDYLYGRLLAIAERLEDMSLYVAGESRSTTAARLMQRFADRPSSTWRNIELALQPYIQRLKNNRAGFLHNIQMLLDEVMNKFNEGDFVNDKPLSGEFLLAYHSQRLDLRNKTKTTENNE